MAQVLPKVDCLGVVSALMLKQDDELKQHLDGFCSVLIYVLGR